MIVMYGTLVLLYCACLSIGHSAKVWAPTVDTIYLLHLPLDLIDVCSQEAERVPAD